MVPILSHYHIKTLFSPNLTLEFKTAAPLLSSSLPPHHHPQNSPETHQIGRVTRLYHSPGSLSSLTFPLHPSHVKNNHHLPSSLSLLQTKSRDWNLLKAYAGRMKGVGSISINLSLTFITCLYPKEFDPTSWRGRREHSGTTPICIPSFSDLKGNFSTWKKWDRNLEKKVLRFSGNFLSLQSLLCFSLL